MIVHFKSYSIVSETFHLRLAELIHRGGVREDFVKTTINSVTTRRTGTQLKVTFRCLKSDRRTGKYATMCLVLKRGQRVLGCHGGGVVQCLLLAGCFGSFRQSSCTGLISVGPGCVGGSLWGSCTRWAYLCFK